MIDWSRYPNFVRDEFACSHTGRCDMRPEFLDVLQAIRTEYGAPMVVSSGYRDKTHPIERKKPRPGEHTMGLCADIAVQGEAAVRLLEVALRHGIKRIGVQQKGAGRFIHLGLGGPGLPSEAIWSY